MNTRLLIPQIKDVFHSNTRSNSENDHIPIPIGTINNLPFGQQNNSLPGSYAKSPLFRGIGPTGYVPPDPDMAAGPNHVVLVVNTAVAFANKSNGQITFQQDIDAFFSTEFTGGIISDPKILFDATSGRWFLTIINPDFDATESWQLVAVSDDADPNGTWTKFKIDNELNRGTSSYWLDYPGWGINKDAIAVTGNMFGYTSGFGGVYLFTIRKAELLTGGSPVVNYFELPNAGTVQTARTYDANLDTIYGMFAASTSAMGFVAFTNLTTAPTMTTTNVNVPSYTRVQQDAASGGNFLDALDGRLFNAMWRNGRLVSSHTVAGNGGVNKVRWYEMTTNGWPTSGNQPTNTQTGEIVGSSGSDTHMPAIAINQRNDIGIVYSRSSAAITSDLLFASRRANDPPGTVGPSSTIKVGSGNYPYGRWGDYFGACIDPIDLNLFWVYGMVVEGSNWNTYFQSFRVSQPADSVVTGVSMVEGKLPSGNLTSILSSNNSYFSVTSLPLLRTGEVCSAQITSTVLANPQSLKIKFEARAAAGITGSVFAWNYTTSAWDYAGSTPLTATDAVKTISLPTPYSKYMSNTRQIKILVRGINPYRAGVTTLPFTLRIDHAIINGLY